MTAFDRDRRHRWAETCERLADFYVEWRGNGEWLVGQRIATDLREIAAYLRESEIEIPSSAKEEG